jgi:hypothetical protein
MALSGSYARCFDAGICAGPEDRLTAALMCWAVSYEMRHRFCPQVYTFVKALAMPNFSREVRFFDDVDWS